MEFARDERWTAAALKAFGARHGLSPDALQAVWPRGLRSVARALNEAADQKMIEDAAGRESPSLEALILKRFVDNLGFKRSVARLAMSDAVHPVDTLFRTALSARAMLQVCGRRDVWHVRWRLVVAYSAAVLVWLIDDSPSQGLTTRAVPILLAASGLGR